MGRNNGFAALAQIKESLPPKIEQPLKTRADYDEVLKAEEPQGHNPNPFDFVLIKDSPSRFTVDEIESGQELYSGQIEIILTPLTPLHIMGKVEPDNPGHTIKKSHFYKEGEDCCIPGSSIKGMLRSFIEAMTNGFVSQAQEKIGSEAYPKIYGTRNPNGRHIGFDSFQPKGEIPAAIPMEYKLDITDKLDIASYLFGYISGNDKGHERRVIVEDATVKEVEKEKRLDVFKMVDIYDSVRINQVNQKSPFMGGAHPSASNWWYMIPNKVWERKPHRIIEMVGGGFWGRKFYFHQNPEECIKYYDELNKQVTRPVYKFEIECLKPIKALEQVEPIKFNIVVERLPKAMLDLLCLSLTPGTIRHKLGYGKQYGYGSIELTINSIKVRNVTKPLDVTKKESWDLEVYASPSWEDRKSLPKIGNRPVIDEQALVELARILGWEDVVTKQDNNIVFTYPPNSRQFFQTPISIDVFERLTLERVLPLLLLDDPRKALDIAKKLWSTKKTIHFLLYQARAKGYRDKIMKRTP